MSRLGDGIGPQKHVIVIGAGPKAAAISAKARSMAWCGFDAPKITIIERSGAAAHWLGDHGYTSGGPTLGTFPEKDVGFPYELSYGIDVIKCMSAEFSWRAFVSDESASDYGISEWIDRGRPNPNHRTWGRYISWVIQKSEATLIQGCVEAMQIEASSRWGLEVRGSDGTVSRITADGVVITGPGHARRVARQAEHELILDGKTFWSNLKMFDELERHGEAEGVCVIGSGETAAAVVVELLSRFRSHYPPPIYIVNRQGVIFSRGESYFENKLFSDPSEWGRLNEREREEFISRTDRGVFSQATLEIIGKARNVRPITAEISDVAVREEPSGNGVVPYVLGDHGGDWVTIDVAAVVVAIGFDPWSFSEMLAEPYRSRITDEQMRRKIRATIKWDLTIPSAVLPAPLHVPMLSGLSQGPGFPNLSCLGSLADRVLLPYSTKRNRAVLHSAS